VASDMKVGVTAYGAAGTKITGTMTVHAGDQTASSITNSTTTLKFLAPEGYYDGTKYVSFTDADFAAGNIRVGYNIFGIDGTYNGQQIGNVKNSILSWNTTQEIIYYYTGSENGQYQFIATRSSSSYFVRMSNDYGVTWTLSFTGQLGSYPIECSADGRVVIFTEGGATNVIKVSTNYGATFTSVTLSGASGIGAYCMSDDGAIIYVFATSGSQYLFKSINSGTSFSAISDSTIAGYKAIDCSSDGSIVYIGRDVASQYIKKSINGGTSFSNLTFAFHNISFGRLYCSGDGSKILFTDAANDLHYYNMTTDVIINSNVVLQVGTTRDIQYTIGADNTLYNLSFSNFSRLFKCGITSGSFESFGTLRSIGQVTAQCHNRGRTIYFVEGTSGGICYRIEQT